MKKVSMNMCPIWTHQIGYLVILYCNDKKFVPSIQLHKLQNLLSNGRLFCLNATSTLLNIIPFLRTNWFDTPSQFNKYCDLFFSFVWWRKKKPKPKSPPKQMFDSGHKLKQFNLRQTQIDSLSIRCTCIGTERALVRHAHIFIVTNCRKKKKTIG